MHLSRIQAVHQWYKEKKISCEELTRAYLRRIQQEHLNAYITVTEEQALETARRVDQRIAAGERLAPLEGIPMTLKDNISTAGIQSTCASRMLKSYVPTYDATVWERLQQENAVLLGKTNMDEFAMGSSGESSYFGATRNPVHSDYVPGGSSSGTAAAVGGGLAVYGLGSDTGGSIRQPASFCGLVGVKPTYGAVSRYGLIAHASGLDQIGPITASVEDAARIMDVICGYDEKDATTSMVRQQSCVQGLNRGIRGLRFGVVKEYDRGVNQEVSSALEQAEKALEALGAVRVPMRLPALACALPVYYVLACAQAASNLARYDGVRCGYRAQHYHGIEQMMSRSRSEGFGREVKHRILLGTYVLSAGYYDAYYQRAQQLKEQIISAFQEAFTCCDFLLAPTAAGTAFRIGEKEKSVDHYQTDICTVPANLAGLPAISVPCGKDSSGLPIGMQLIGAKFQDSLILRAAYCYEQYTQGANLCQNHWEDMLWNMN